MNKAFIVVGLGFGDEGKGATTDFLCREYKADLVVKYCGGSQCGHNVELTDGTRHCFSQFGSGTFVGVPTYLGPNFIIYPEALIKEATSLSSKGISSPLNLIRIHPSCLVTTEYHRAINRMSEEERGENRHGSCGHGIGETRKYWLEHGQDAVFAGDLRDRELLKQKLELMRQRFLLKGIAQKYQLTFQKSSVKIANELRDIGSTLRISEKPYLLYHNVVVFEGSQGILLDENLGFRPHVTWSTTTERHALDMIEEENPKVETEIIGCIRPYFTRHGEGRLLTYSPRLTESVGNQGNPDNEWQGKFRAGYLDSGLVNYIKQIAKPDFLSVSCLDHFNGYVPTYITFTMNMLKQIAPIKIEGRGPTYKDRKVVL